MKEFKGREGRGRDMRLLIYCSESSFVLQIWEYIYFPLLVAAVVQWDRRLWGSSSNPGHGGKVGRVAVPKCHFQSSSLGGTVFAPMDEENRNQESLSKIHDITSKISPLIEEVI